MAEEFKKKPTGGKAYGHIPHLPLSRMGPGDHKCSEGQARIATEKARDKYDRILLQEKSDGSCCSVAKLNGVIIPLTRAGYVANTSPYEQHHHFYNWVMKNQQRFFEALNEGERFCGEALIQAHGTRYNLPHEPFVIFDLMKDTGMNRVLFEELKARTEKFDFILPNTVHIGGPISIEKAMALVSKSGHGALDPVEGAVWRVERNELIDKHSGIRRWLVDFLVKYVRPDKKDGIYLPEISGKEPIWNWRP